MHGRYWRRDMHLAVLRIDSDQYGPSRTLDCVSAPLVDKMLFSACRGWAFLMRSGSPSSHSEIGLGEELSLHDTDGMWVSNMYVIHFGS